MPKIIFRYDDGREIVSFASQGANLLEAAEAAGVAIDAPCAGNGVCGKCRVRLLEGVLDSGRSMHITPEDLEAGYRLACVSRVVGDVVIGVPTGASDFQTGIRTADITSEKEIGIFNDARAALQAAGIERDNGFCAVAVTLDEPTLEDTMPDNERLARALLEQQGCEVHFSSTAVKNMSRVLREGGFSVVCAAEKRADGLFVYDLFPADADVTLCGVAVDIGTTTVSAILVDLATGDILAKASAGNGQIRHGADVINRIIASCREGGSERLQNAVMDTIRPMIAGMCAECGVQPGCVYRMTVAANTTMNHLFFGCTQTPFGWNPTSRPFSRPTASAAAISRSGSTRTQTSSSLPTSAAMSVATSQPGHW